MSFNFLLGCNVSFNLWGKTFVAVLVVSYSRLPSNSGGARRS